jgi:copper chaperone CopZ
MSCGHCVGTITKAVQSAVKGANVNVDLAGGRVEVGGTEDADVVRKAIEDAGYEVLGRAA